MGEDVDFFDAGFEDTQLTAKLESLEFRPTKARELSRILQRHCGHDLQFGLHEAEKGHAKQRDRTKTLLDGMKKSAAKLLEDDGRDVFHFGLVLDELLPNKCGPEERSALRNQILQAVMILAALPPLSKPLGRTLVNVTAKKAVRGVREYCDLHETYKFAGGPKRNSDRSWASNAVQKGSPATKLTNGVLSALGLPLDVGALDEAMRAAREEDAWF